LVDQGPMHHQFCCKTTIVEYFDPSSAVQVATYHHQDYVDPAQSPVITLRMFRVGQDVYILLPDWAEDKTPTENDASPSISVKPQ
jgi:hypothetical protein